MPRLTKQQLAQVKYVSMADFYNKLDQIDNFNDKLQFTTRYLLTHSTKRNPDYSIEEAIHLAKAKLVDEAVKQHDKYMKETHGKDTEAHIVNPYSKDDKAAEMFMANPVDYLVGEANKAIKEINDQKIIIPEERHLEEEYLKTLDSMSINVREQVKALDKGSRVLDVKARMEAKFGGRENVSKAYQATKGGFMSRLFGTSSAAAKNLDQVYNAFNNPNHVLYGNTDALDKAACQYIQHNFPDWEPFMQLPTDAEMAHLSETEKARMKFSINTLKCLKEQNEMEEKFNSLVNACEEKNIEYKDLKQAENHKVINLDGSEIDLDDESEKSFEVEANQKDFREQLRVDIKENEEDYSISEDVEEKVNEKEIEEEQLDDLNNTN